MQEDSQTLRWRIRSALPRGLPAAICRRGFGWAGEQEHCEVGVIRNTIGLVWHPQAGEPWGMDRGSDWRGDDQPSAMGGGNSAGLLV
jgi:hypothetical protein